MSQTTERIHELVRAEKETGITLSKPLGLLRRNFSIFKMNY